ncbi:unnamed protein product [Caenorhabditis sp. 36 PRJEB53466]|nr:unnamed protein product [Caenorhabditis sp. 36 PRJEB53466]
MVTWSDLSIDLKSKVIKDLDLLSRFRLRAASRLDRKVVDFSEHRIPRVNISEKNGIFDMTVYWKIDRFVRIRLEQGDADSTIMHRTQRLKNTHKKSITCAKTTPLKLFAQIFRQIVFHRKTTIGTLETAISDHIDVRELLKLSEELAKTDDDDIRAEVLSIHTLERSNLPFLGRCHSATLRDIELCYDGIVYTFLMCEKSTLDEKKAEELTAAGCWEYFHGCGLHVARKYNVNGREVKEKCEELKESSPLSVAVQKVSRSVRIKFTGCGRICEKVDGKGGDDYCEVTKSTMPCLLRWACPTHADAFTHWYYRKERHRILGPKYWTNKLDEVAIPIASFNHIFC